MCWIICHIKRQFSHKMTPILFWNIKQLFVRFTFCHRTPVTLDTQWQNACTFLERINSRSTTEHDSTLSLRSSRNQGRCKLLPRNSAAAMSSSGHSSEVRRSFRVSTGRRAVSSSEVNCRVPAAYRAEFHRTVCIWPPISPDLNPVDCAVWGALQQSVYCIPISNLDDLRQSAHLLGESWPTDHQQVHWSLAWQTEGSSSSEWWTHWTAVLNTVSA